MGFRGGDRHPQRVDGILPGDKWGPTLLDRVEEILQLAAKRFFLSHVDLLLMVLERDLVEVERVERTESARTHGDRLLGVVDLDEVFQTGEGEPPHLHRRQPVHLDDTVDAILESEQDVRMVVDVPVELPSSEGEDAFRSEEHTSELQSQSNLVCRLLLEKKKTL